jgi:MFS family permease
MNTLGIFQAYIATHQLSNYSEGTIGWIFSIYIFMAWLCGIFVGPLFDKYGPRWLISVGSVCVVGSMMLLGECTGKLLYIFLRRSLVLICYSLLAFYPSLGNRGRGWNCLVIHVAAVGHYFSTRRGNATGIACTGGSIGGIIFPFILQKLIPEIGFPWSCRIVGFISLFLCIIANILIKSRLPPLENADAYPDLRIFKSAPFSITTLSVFLIEWGLFVPITYISSYALS